jgi:hypothetical protein
MSAQPSPEKAPPGEGPLEEILRRLEALEKRLGPSKHEHTLKPSQHENEVYCVDCGVRYVKYDGFDSALELLKRPHGHDNKDFLSCPSCRPKFVDMLKGLGYEVRDYGKDLLIRRKR